MNPRGPARKGQRARYGVLLLLSGSLATPLLAQHPGAPRPAPRAGGDVYGGRGPGGMGRPMPGGRDGNEHLPQWFAQHQGLGPRQQEQALRDEPGFSHLPTGQQQQLIDRLHRLDSQSPEQRQRVMARNERFMALPPERQQEIRGASRTLGEMNPDRRQAVRQAFRDLRNVPEDQRMNALNSARFQAEYSPQERSVLRSLLSIEPDRP